MPGRLQSAPTQGQNSGSATARQQKQIVLGQGTAASVVRVLLALNTCPSKVWKLLLPGTGELVLNAD